MYLRGVNLQQVPSEVLPFIQRAWKLRKSEEIQKVLIQAMQPFVGKFADLQGVLSNYLDTACYGMPEMRELFPIKSKEDEVSEVQTFYDKLFAGNS